MMLDAAVHLFRCSYLAFFRSWFRRSQKPETSNQRLSKVLCVCNINELFSESMPNGLRLLRLGREMELKLIDLRSLVVSHAQQLSAVDLKRYDKRSSRA